MPNAYMTLIKYSLLVWQIGNKQSKHCTVPLWSDRFNVPLSCLFCLTLAVALPVYLFYETGRFLERSGKRWVYIWKGHDVCIYIYYDVTAWVSSRDNFFSRSIFVGFSVVFFWSKSLIFTIPWCKSVCKQEKRVKK